MEIKLRNILQEVNIKMGLGISPEEKKNIENRRKNEIKTFEEKIKKDLGEYITNSDNISKIKDKEKIGRQSGSLEWRKKRGEC